MQTMKRASFQSDPKVPVLNSVILHVRAAFMLACIAILASCATAPGAQSPAEALASRPLSEIAEAIRSGEVTSEAMVEVYLARIERYDRDGPRLNSVLALNPHALADARARDRARASGAALGPLHGVPILIKDNIETADPMATTAGSLALIDNITGRDSPLVAQLRAAGAVILGKTNLSEWANFRSNASISGWSGAGGQVRNPYVLDRSPCGSSSGSGAAVAVGLAAAAIGTETNGSISCPASMNGVVGFKPTVGLISQAHIVPISATQDTGGPMTRTVRDAAILLQAMVEPSAPAFTLNDDALRGVRVGVLRFAVGEDAEMRAVFSRALNTLEAAGAELVEIETFETPEGFWDDAFKVLLVEFRAGIDDYLATTPSNVGVRSLADLIAFNEMHAARELALFDQSILEMSLSQPGLADAEYLAARMRVLAATREDGIDRILRAFNVSVLVAPTGPAAFLIDPVHGDAYPEGVGAGWIAAIAGYPHLSVPMGEIRGLPVGLSFMGAAHSDAAIFFGRGARL